MGVSDAPDRPIGIFDSGVGGLTVARAVLDQLPHEPILYVGDTARGPYGPLPIATVRSYALDVMDHLVESGVKMLVIACNSASAAVLRDARERYDVPVVEVVHPAVRRAVRRADMLAGMPASISTVAVGSARIRYETTGAGPALVLAHAGVCDRRSWDDLVAPLAAGHRVVRLDFRGFGETELPPERFSHRDDLAAVIGHAEAAPAVLVGASMGAAAAVDDIRKQGIEVETKFIGFDFPKPLVDALQDGKIDAIVAQDPRRMGYLAVETLVTHLRGEEVPRFIDTGVKLVTKEALAEDEQLRKLVGAEEKE